MPQGELKGSKSAKERFGGSSSHRSDGQIHGVHKRVQCQREMDQISSTQLCKQSKFDNHATAVSHEVSDWP